ARIVLLARDAVVGIERAARRPGRISEKKRREAVRRAELDDPLCAETDRERVEETGGGLADGEQEVVAPTCELFARQCRRGGRFLRDALPVYVEDALECLIHRLITLRVL